MLRRKLRLAQTQPEFEAQAKAFLQRWELPQDEFTLGSYAALVQAHETDVLVERDLAAKVRKHRANSFAYYLMHPDRKPKNEKALKVADGEVADETRG